MGRSSRRPSKIAKRREERGARLLMAAQRGANRVPLAERASFRFVSLLAACDEAQIVNTQIEALAEIDRVVKDSPHALDWHAAAVLDDTGNRIGREVSLYVRTQRALAGDVRVLPALTGEV